MTPIPLSTLTGTTNAPVESGPPMWGCGGHYLLQAAWNLSGSIMNYQTSGLRGSGISSVERACDEQCIHSRWWRGYVNMMEFMNQRNFYLYPGSFTGIHIQSHLFQVAQCSWPHVTIYPGFLTIRLDVDISNDGNDTSSESCHDH